MQGVIFFQNRQGVLHISEYSSFFKEILITFGGDIMAVDRSKKEKVYVRVSTDFDSTGYMQPRSITWGDGRTFNIDKIKDFRPANIYREDCGGYSGFPRCTHLREFWFAQTSVARGL